MPIRAVIFDLFDTLVDLRTDQIAPVEIDGRRVPGTARALHAALNDHYPVSLSRFVDALLAVDAHWRERDLPRGIEFATTERFRRVLDALDLRAPEQIEALTEVHMSALRAHAHPVDEHPEVLSRLAARAKLGLCSNFSHTPTALGVLEEARLHHFFDAPVVSVDLGIRKPRPEIFEATLARLGVSAEEAIHVGDNLEADVAGATPVGLRTVWITRRVADPAAALAQYRGPAPTWTVAALGDIEALLDA